MDFERGIAGKYDSHFISFILYTKMSGTLRATGPPYEADQSITAHRPQQDVEGYAFHLFLSSAIYQVNGLLFVS